MYFHLWLVLPVSQILPTTDSLLLSGLVPCDTSSLLRQHFSTRYIFHMALYNDGLSLTPWNRLDPVDCGVRTRLAGLVDCCRVCLLSSTFSIT